jgi:glycine cleavage system aminomethyltransferase T
MSLELEVHALRSSVTLAELEHVARCRVTGPDAHAVVDAICPRELFLYEGQMLHTLLFDSDGEILADLHIARDEHAFLLFADGVDGAELVQALRAHAPASASFSAEDLAESHALISLNGPYAWELLSEAFTPEIIGLPYLGCSLLADELLCLRTGRVGEYGYDLLVLRSERAELERNFESFASEFDLVHVSMEALAVCALENFVFNPRGEGRSLRDPLELQLQWRLSYKKEYPGVTRHREQRTRGLERRAVLVASDAALFEGDEIRAGAELIGQIVSARRSPTRGDYLGVARIALAYSAPGLAAYGVARAGGNATVRVISAPAVNNRSVYVDPQRHNYRARATQEFPPLVLGA